MRRTRHSVPLLFSLTIGVIPVAAVVPGSARAQSQLAQIQGRVVSNETGKPVAGVTVVVLSPSLGDPQSEVTDSDGRYLINQLPPGDGYEVAFYYGSSQEPRQRVEGLRLSLGKTVSVNGKIKLSAAKGEVKVIRESAPNVDTASANTGVEINQEVLKNTPVRGRTFEAVVALAPGVADVAPRAFSLTGGATAGGDVGTSVAGSSGNENSFVIDGINTSDPNLGVIGTELNQYFIKEVDVITGGYQAEYGRATGGVITIATKTGGNDFHGSVFGSIQPYQLDPPAVARLGEAIATREKTQTLFDFGFDLGGRLVKDRVWFYVGFAPTFTNVQIQRRFRAQVYDPVTQSAQRDPDFNCPSYLASSLYCDGPGRLARTTQDLDGYGQDLMRSKRLYNWIAKLTFNINENHNVTLAYIGAPTTYDDYTSTGSYAVDDRRYTRTDQIHDVNARYIGKFLERKLQLDLLYGFHYQGSVATPVRADVQSLRYNASPDNPNSLADFEAVSPCQRVATQVLKNGDPFNPCPLTEYTRGFGQYQSQILQRHQALAAITGYANFTKKWNPLRGLHAIKLGFDFEYLRSDNTRSYSGTDLSDTDPTSGHRSYATNGDGSQLRIEREFATKLGGQDQLLNSFRGVTATRNFAVYLRDSWTVGWAPGLVINAGVRWEGQEIFGQDLMSDPMNPGVGEKAITIYDNWAPRIGLAWDFTQLTSRPGRAKVFFNYGRFYQSVPLDINDRQFTGEGIRSTRLSLPGTCQTGPIQSGGRPVIGPTGCEYERSITNGGSYGQVAPGLKGQYVNEIVVGIDYDVGYDIVLGASYIHRDLGNIIEDLSTDGGNFYLLSNPGQQPDPALLARLESDLAAMRAGILDNGGRPEDSEAYSNAKQRLDAYRVVGNIFPRATRNYDALVLKLNKRLSNRFSIISSYTYSRTIGNYPGTYSSSNGQLDPNISSQFDLVDLLANRNGPLPNDRPHNFKVTGFYEQPIRKTAKLTFGLTFTAYSGRPIEVLGYHPYYNDREVYILPRGAGGRTPPITQFDLHIGYDQQLGKRVTLNLYADIVNLFNQKAVVNVDDEYTKDEVAPIINGRAEDLKHLKGNNGLLPIANSNYGQPTDYQAPLYLRFGGRLSF